MEKKYNLGAFERSYNLATNRGGVAKDQIVMVYENARVFKSYSSIIAIKYNDGSVIIGRDYKYSKITSTYRCKFLGESLKETDNKLSSDHTYKYDYNLK